MANLLKFAASLLFFWLLGGVVLQIYGTADSYSHGLLLSLYPVGFFVVVGATLFVVGKWWDHQHPDGG